MAVMILRDVFPNWISGDGIFEHIENPPWDGYITAAEANFRYFGNHSGAKFASPLVMALIESGTISQENLARLAGVIKASFAPNWKRLWDTMVVEYSPINNYDMHEIIDRELTGEDNNTNTKNLTSTTDHGLTNTSDDYIYGFNSSSESPSNKYVSADSGQTSTTDGGTDVDEGDNHEIEHTEVQRRGNIGVTTNQQMLTAERELWEWNFLDHVFADIDKILALPLYDECRV